MTSWYFDSIDVRGGLAVATLREPDLEKSNLVEAGPSVFISAPTFVPEHIANRSIGLGLSRGRGQIGLFRDAGGEEVPFDSLAAITEFVRRAYVRGAGGDGPDENGGGKPPGEPPSGEAGGGDPLPEFSEVEGGSDPVLALIALDEANNGKIAALSVGASNDAAATLTLVSASGSAARIRLARGALYVLRELMRREVTSDQLDWSIAVEKLLCMICRMGLQQTMSREITPSSSEGEESTKARLPTHPDWVGAAQLLEECFDWHPRYRFCCRGCSADAFIELATFPVPIGLTDNQLANETNLQALLSVALAEPGLLSSAKEQLAELILFAAAAIVLGKESVSLTYHNIVAHLEIGEKFSERIALRALEWIADNLPKRVFASEVEEIIQTAASVPP